MPPASAVQSTRERILAYLDENPLASAQGLSRAWGLTRADIRYHLNALEREGLIEPVARPGGTLAGRGRPVKHYRRASGAGRSYAELCRALLEVVDDAVPEEQREAALRKTAERLAAGHAVPDSPVQRMNETVRFLTQLGYRARWEASARGPRVLLRGCPYAALLEAHPEICQVDCFLLETLTGLQLRQDARINLETGRPPACVFSPEWVRP